MDKYGFQYICTHNFAQKLGLHPLPVICSLMSFALVSEAFSSDPATAPTAPIQLQAEGTSHCQSNANGRQGCQIRLPSLGVEAIEEASTQPEQMITRVEWEHNIK